MGSYFPEGFYYLLLPLLILEALKLRIYSVSISINTVVTFLWLFIMVSSYPLLLLITLVSFVRAFPQGAIASSRKAEPS